MEQTILIKKRMKNKCGWTDKTSRQDCNVQSVHYSSSSCVEALQTWLSLILSALISVTHNENLDMRSSSEMQPVVDLLPVRNEDGCDQIKTEPSIHRSYTSRAERRWDGWRNLLAVNSSQLHCTALRCAVHCTALWMPVLPLSIQGGRGRSKWFLWHSGTTYGWHITTWMEGGLGRWGAGGPVISYWRHWIGLLCPCDWMVYVFNVAGIGSITVSLGKNYKGHQTQSKAASVWVCGVCALLMLW